MSYCWRSHVRDGQHADTPGFQWPATHELRVFQTSPSVLKATMSQLILARAAVSDRGGRRLHRGRPFLKNHMQELAALDFFVVPTVTYKVLFVLLVLAVSFR
jgi:hypothetical protein